MSLSIQRTAVEQFNFQGKSVRSVHVQGTGECLVANDVWRAVGYDRDFGLKQMQRLVPKRYKMRLGDALPDMEGVDKCVHTQPNTVLLKEAGLYCFLLRCGKPEADSFMEWVCEEVLPREVRKLAAAVQEKDKIIDEKDAKLALLNDDLTESENLVRELEYNNTGLQGEIRAKDQEIERRREEVQDLIQNRHVPRRNLIDNVLCFIDKQSDEKHQFYIIRCQRRRLEHHKKCLRNRYPNMIILGECDDGNAVHRWCRFKEDCIHDFYRNHFNLDEEGRELFETAFDIEI